MLTKTAEIFGTVTAGTLMVFGLYATGKTRFLPVRAFPAAFRQIKGSKDPRRTVSPFKAFATSLGGTIGVGNLTGVSLALASGGAGAVFWMWVSAFVCMTVKYFEIFLAVKYQPEGETNYGFGSLCYVKKALKSNAFSGLFALFGLLSALMMGSMIQTNAAANCAKETFGLPPAVVGLLFTLAAGAVLGGGVKRIMGLTEKAVPLLGGLFLTVAVTVIGLHFSRIPSAFRQIFQGALSFRSAAGGFLGTGIAAAFRAGVSNGLFSHEAGLGSAGLAHGACGAKPEEQGLWGIFEVFADTVVISTLSALMLLTTGKTGSVTEAAGKALGPVGEAITALCLISFAFLSVVSWSCYGETCFVWLCGRKSVLAYRILFLLTPLPAAFLTESTLWQTSEVVNAMMMLLNLAALTIFRGELKQIGKISFRK